jgi:beta-glucosidase
MGFIKKLLKPRVIVWAATTLVLTAVLIVADYMAMNKYVKLIEATDLGGDKPILDPNQKGNAFAPDFASKDAAFNNGNEVAKQICEEGMILLKNDNAALPLAKGAKVTVFGRNSIDLVYGGSGSAAPGKSSNPAYQKKYGWRKTINDSLKEAGFSVNPEMEKFYSKQKVRDPEPGLEDASGQQKAVATLFPGEASYDKYTDPVKQSYGQYGDAALIVVSRIAGEGWDLPRQAYDNDQRHYLELDNAERALIKEVASSGKFKKIILLLNGSNYIDLGFLYERTNSAEYNEFGKYIDAVINIGSPGANGIMALGGILNGTVNPSGHTVDTVYTAYQNDPTWQNFGGNKSFQNPNGTDNYTRNGSPSDYYLVEYEENIYLGYRYYETRGKVEGEDWYNANVVYPFGYGLSYTKFSQEITNVSALEGEALEYGKTFKVQIEVKNTGDVAGKQVVQLYASAPYTAGGIEKAHKVLVGFAKTKELKKNETDTVEITVNPYDFASFDSQDKNGNGFNGYELEKGEYTFYAGTDAHNSFGEFKKNLAADVQIDKDPVTGYKVEPLFPELTAHMNPAESLSRNNFAGTFPKVITDTERALDEDTFAKLKSQESTNDETYDKVPTMGAEVKYTLRDLAGKKYNDPMWDEFLDQFTFDEMLMLFNDGCYSTASITRKMKVINEETHEEEEKNVVIVPKTTSADGPTGIVGFLGDPSIYGCCYYQSECLLAQTYNVELADLQAKAIGNECLIGNEAGGGLAYPGWYAPGVNLHRSPFSGRNTEYYSEDPFLNGRFAGRVIKGVAEKGVYANVKHFAVNDQETHRSTKGIATWVDEQAMRELYLKAFEMAVKEGEAHGLMTSFNRIGTEWAGGSYRLCTTVLRKEWGFQGSVICDFHTDFYMDSKQMLYAGGDLNLCADKEIKLQTSGRYSTPYVKATNAKDANLVRRSAHNNLFALANSCALKVDVIRYELAWWKVLFRVVEIAIPVALAGWGFAVIFTALRKKEKAAAAE